MDFEFYYYYDITSTSTITTIITTTTTTTTIMIINIMTICGFGLRKRGLEIKAYSTGVC